MSDGSDLTAEKLLQIYVYIRSLYEFRLFTEYAGKSEQFIKNGFLSKDAFLNFTDQLSKQKKKAHQKKFNPKIQSQNILNKMLHTFTEKRQKRISKFNF